MSQNTTDSDAYRGEQARTGIPGNIDDARRTAPEGASIAAITTIADELDDSDADAAELWERWKGDAEEVSECR